MKLSELTKEQKEKQNQDKFFDKLMNEHEEKLNPYEMGSWTGTDFFVFVVDQN